jgi:hypothetical protein
VAGQGLVRLASSLGEAGQYTVLISIEPLYSLHHVAPLPVALDPHGQGTQPAHGKGDEPRDVVEPSP